MNNVTLTPKQLSVLIKNSEIIGNGSYGILYQLDNDTLFKFNYKDFFDDFEYVDGKLNFNQLGDISEMIKHRKEARIDTRQSELLHKLLSNNKEYNEKCKQLLNYLHMGKEAPRELFDELFKIEERCKKDNIAMFSALKFDYTEEIKYALNAMRKQNKIKHTILPQGIVLVNDYSVGFVLKNHINMVDLFKYLLFNDISETNKEIIYNNIKIAITELITNGIFHNDFTVRNIMVNPDNYEIQIIDTDDVVCLDDTEETKGDNLKRISRKTREIYSSLDKIHNYICKSKSDDLEL